MEVVLLQRLLLSKVSQLLTCGEDFDAALAVVGCLAGDRVTVAVEVVGLTDGAIDEGGGEVITPGFVVVSNFSFTIDSYNDIITHNICHTHTAEMFIVYVKYTFGFL